MFALGVLAGIYLLVLILQKKETPKFVAVIHGLFVLVAVILLIMYVKDSPGLTESLVLFIMAALGGMVLIYRDLTGKTIPRWLAVGHALIAIAGFAFLLAYAY